MMLDFLPGSSTALDSVDADSEESAITTIGRRLSDCGGGSEILLGELSNGNNRSYFTVVLLFVHKLCKSFS